jgi:hypothetical protein
MIPAIHSTLFHPKFVAENEADEICEACYAIAYLNASMPRAYRFGLRVTLLFSH